MKKVILDTNAISALFRGSENVLRFISQAETVYISAIVLGELYTGFKHGSKEEQNRQWLTKLLEKPTVQTVDVSNETAEIYSDIMKALRKMGTPIPTNDVWLAAQAFETGSVLITLDKHFKNVQGLRLAF
jgi:tRNA(fMet)-specific endonuclease VapC